ncbi:hypothetical protein XH88_24070 [Bradyrhizobium sp. CCBAU 51627]|nr:hypothetical protein [Bradyrhizobium sp. CCBAU 51627]
MRIADLEFNTYAGMWPRRIDRLCANRTYEARLASGDHCQTVRVCVARLHQVGEQRIGFAVPLDAPIPSIPPFLPKPPQVG